MKRFLTSLSLAALIGFLTYIIPLPDQYTNLAHIILAGFVGAVAFVLLMAFK